MSGHEKFDLGGKVMSDEMSESSHHHSADKKCDHDKDDILWRETVSQQHFITTSPHPHFIVETDDSTTVTPLSDLSQESHQKTFLHFIQHNKLCYSV